MELKDVRPGQTIRVEKQPASWCGDLDKGIQNPLRLSYPLTFKVRYIAASTPSSIFYIAGEINGVLYGFSTKLHNMALYKQICKINQSITVI